jgi:hypothetical protein
VVASGGVFPPINEAGADGVLEDVLCCGGEALIAAEAVVEEITLPGDSGFGGEPVFPSFDSA